MGFERIYYYFAIIIGAVAAILYYVLFLIKNKTEKRLAVKILLISSLSAVFALGVSLLSAFLIYPALKTDFSQRFVNAGFQYYITMLFFVVFSSGLFHLQKIDFKFSEGMILPLVLFSIIARTGCLVAGCCAGGAWSEFIFAIISFAVLFIIKQNRLPVYLTAYSIFRFISEFFRADTGMIKIASLSVFQYLSIIVIIFFTLFYALNYNELKQKKSA